MLVGAADTVLIREVSLIRIVLHREALLYVHIGLCSAFLPCVCVVDADEIRRLSRSFRRLDLNQNGALDVDEFLQIPELQQNPLVRRVIEIFDEDGNGEVDFKGEKCR